MYCSKPAHLKPTNERARGRAEENKQAGERTCVDGWTNRHAGERAGAQPSRQAGRQAGERRASAQTSELASSRAVVEKATGRVGARADERAQTYRIAMLITRSTK